MQKNIKVLVIDDEKPTRVVLRHLIEEIDVTSFQIIEARNGRVGGQLLEAENPDIVILDINMPYMNGVEFLDEYERQLTNTKIIIISGYNEFQFAQKTIRYNVMGYLLKPINRQEFYKVFMKTVEKIQMDSIMNEKISKVLKNEKIEFLKNAVYKNCDINDQSYTSVRDALSSYKEYLVCILRWNEELINQKDSRDFGEHWDSHNIRIYINEFLENKCDAICFESKTQENLLILYGKDILFQNILSVLSTAFQNKFGTRVLIAVGGVKENSEGLFDSFCEAKQNIGQIDLLLSETKSEKRDIDTDNYKNLLRTYRVPIRNAYIKNDGSKLNSIIRDIIDQIKKCAVFTVNQAELLVRQYIIYIDEFFVENGKNKASVIYIPDWRLRLNQVTSIDDFVNFLNWISIKTIGEIKTKELNLDWVLEDIKTHLEAEYACELKLDKLAERYNFSKQHLNKKFKSKYNYCIYEYLLMIRMEQAQKLLLNSNMDINEIAVSVGYNDQGYFSKAFKKFYGMSPNSYREGN